MNNKEKLDFIKNFYRNISDEDLKKRLQNAGFDIVEGVAGEIIVDDVDDEGFMHIEKPDFTIPTVVHKHQKNQESAATFSINYYLGAIA